jgi:phosphoribosyl-AMP cyclohydrolase / phosphoribosyl-ATP pyrophosphohydrolase
LWTKGETSGHFLELHSIAVDCDGDALLVLARPSGPVCHLGTRTCWGDGAPRPGASTLGFLHVLEQVVMQRGALRPEGSYTARLLGEGTRRVAQKVGEEAIELAIAGVAQSDPEVLGEAADLVYHLMLLLQTRGLTLAQVVGELAARHEARRA